MAFHLTADFFPISQQLLECVHNVIITNRIKLALFFSCDDFQHKNGQKCILFSV